MQKIINPTLLPATEKNSLNSNVNKSESSRDFQSTIEILEHPIPDGLFLLQDGKIKYSDQKFAKKLGYNTNEITELSLSDIVAPNDREKVLERYKRRQRGEKVPPHYQIDFIDKSKQIIVPCSISTGIVEPGNEKLQYVIVKDLSKKSKAENKFIEEVQLQKYFIDYLPDSIYFKDINSKFIKANKATLTKMGLNSIDDLLGKTDFDIFQDEHAKQAMQDEAEIIKNRTSKINKIEKETWLNGKITWASTTKLPLIDENDNVYGTLGITRDITSLKKAEDAKDAMFKISSAVTSQSNINLLYAFIHNVVSELMKAENFYIALYHKETETVSFPYFVDQVDKPPAERKAGRGLTEYIIRSGEAHLIDAEMDIKLREAGETSLLGEPTQIWLGVPLKVEGNTIGAIVVQDYYDASTYGEEEKEILIYVSEQIAQAIEKKRNEEKIIKYSEELKATNATKDKFFSIIAHDLKSPFHGLLGLTRMIVEEYHSLTENEVRDYLQVLKDSTESTYKLIENLLEWARLQSKRMKFNPALQNMFLIVEDIRILLNQNAREKKINIRNKLSHQSFVWGDDTMLQSLMQNLISNAIKFTPAGGNIEVTENRFDDYIEYSVSDSGVGIKEADIKKLFRIDVSFSTRGTQQEKGTGLGLSLCKEIVNIHGGEIKVQSKAGEGTKVSFTINKQKNN